MTQDPLRSFFRHGICAALLRGEETRGAAGRPASAGLTYLDDDVEFVRVLDALQDLLRQREALLHELLPLRLRNKCAPLRQWRAAGGERGHEAAEDGGCEREERMG